MSFDWKGTIGKIAPWLAGTLGTPAAGLAVGALCKAFGFSESPENAQKAAQLAAAGSMTGEQFLALQVAEQEHREKMMGMGYENLEALEEIAFKDRDSARNMAIKTGDVWTPRVLAAAVVVGWFSVQWFLLHKLVPAENREMILRGLGTLDMAIGLVLGYFFGSSVGSARKDEIAAQQKNL